MKCEHNHPDQQIHFIHQTLAVTFHPLLSSTGTVKLALLILLTSLLILAGCTKDRAYPGEPLPVLSITNITMTEGNAGTSNMLFTVTLSTASTTAITVNYATANATALAGSDYTAVNGLLTIPANSTTATITVVVKGDLSIEADETFTLNLSRPTAATIAIAQATATIVNDDFPTLSIANSSVTEGNVGTSNMLFTVTLSATSLAAITVNYATSNATALAGSDYLAANATLTIPSGASSGTITVLVNGDTTNEPDETFTVTLSNATAATINSASATATIINDDLPTLSISNASVVEGSNLGSTNLIFNITLSVAAPNIVSVNYATADGTALSSSDYTAGAATLNIAAGLTSGTVTVLVAADTITFESNETLSVTLSNAVNATISTATATGTILNDDAAYLNDTGIALWGNATNNNLTVSQVNFPRQDADFGRDANVLLNSATDGKLGFSFTKLDATGAPLSNQTLPGTCVLDQTTGLMWEVKSNAAGLRNKNHTYSWLNNNNTSNGGAAGSANLGTCADAVNCDTEKYIAAVNGAGLCGHSDWRLPGKEALRSVLDYSIASPGPAIDTAYFTNSIGNKYWSATARDSASAWYVDFSLSNTTGSANTGTKSTPYRIRLVRGGL